MNALSPFQAYTHYLRDTELVPYVYEYVMDWDDAADVVREAVTEVLSHESDFDSSTGPEGLRNWLRKICRRKAKSYQPATSTERYTDWGNGGDEMDDDPDEFAEKLGTAQAFYHHRKHLLTPMQQKCFSAEIAGESQTEAAQWLGVSVQNVNQHLQYAKKKMNYREYLRATSKAQQDRARSTEAEAARRTMDALLANIRAEQQK